MPYRRLPNTNQARLRTLKSAVEQGQKIGDIRNLAFSLKTLEEASEMLKDLSGTCHYVVSGLAIKRGERLYLTSETTLVKMRPLSEKEIDTYVSRFKPLDKAGAYGIQEMAGAFVEKIDGDFYNVVGLPLCKLVKVLKEEFDLYLI